MHFTPAEVIQRRGDGGRPESETVLIPEGSEGVDFRNTVRIHVGSIVDLGPAGFRGFEIGQVYNVTAIAVPRTREAPRQDG